MGKHDKASTLGEAGVAVAMAHPQDTRQNVWDTSALSKGASSVHEQSTMAPLAHGFKQLGAVAGSAGFGAIHSNDKEYVDMNHPEKAEALVSLMKDSQGILKNNGIPAGDDRVLAAHMINEGGRNGRRQMLGNHFSREASGLEQQLTKSGLDVHKLGADKAARANLEKHLDEDQRFLLDRVVSGKLDLSALTSKDGAVKKAEKEKLTEAGIDKRVEQYQEMERLQKDQREGKKQSKDEAQRLKNLRSMHGHAVGFDGQDGGSHFGDMSGLSDERFREIYSEGQQRFEPRQYKALREDYDVKSPAYLKGDQKKALEITASSIGRAHLDKAHVAGIQQHGNYDLLADLGSSYGTSQIMGLYAFEGLLKAKDSSGAAVSYDLSAAKRSKDRLSPTTEDVNMQVALFNMYAGDRHQSLSKMMGDTGTLTTTYNGAQPGSKKYKRYKQDLDDALPLYDREKAAAAQKSHPVPNPVGHYAD